MAENQKDAQASEKKAPARKPAAKAEIGGEA